MPQKVGDRMKYQINNNVQLDILSLEDSNADGKRLDEYLCKHSNYSIHLDRVANEADFISAMTNKQYDIILGEYFTHNCNGFAVLEHIKSICPDTPFICVSEGISGETVAELFENGAMDYVSKKNLGRLMNVIERALKSTEDLKNQRKSLESLTESRDRLDFFFRQSFYSSFFMMLDAPIDWNDTTDKEETLDYVFAHQHMTEINQAMLDLYGYTPESILNKTPNDLWKHNMEQGRRIWQGIFDNGQLHIDTIEQRSDGSKIWIEGHYICVYDKNKSVVGIFGIQKDITKQKSAQEKFCQKQEPFQGLFNKDPIGWGSLDSNGNFITMNQL